MLTVLKVLIGIGRLDLFKKCYNQHFCNRLDMLLYLEKIGEYKI